MRGLHDSATVEFVPPPRLAPPACETADLVVAAPKDVAPPTRANPVVRFLPVVTALAAVALMAWAFHARSGASRNPAFMLFPVMMLVSAVTTAVSGADRRSAEINTERAQYLAYLTGLRAAAVESRSAQYDSLLWCYPAPADLWTLVGGDRMWERRGSAADFCHLRIGIGSRRPARALVAPSIDATHRLDPVTLEAMQRFVDTYSTVADVPVTIEVAGVVAIHGETSRARGLLRAMICQLAVMSSPMSILIAGAVSDHVRPEWDWLKWLPHNRHPWAGDAAGAVRLMYPSVAAVKSALAGLSADHRLVVVEDDGAGRIALLTIGDDSGVAAISRLQITGNTVEAELSSGERALACPDQMSGAEALACAQRLAGYRSGGTTAATGQVSWQGLTGIADVAGYSAADCWTSRHPRDRLRVPIGTAAQGAPVELDIKEAAENGHGPHGLCIGATGSGKSEFLRTVALGMIALHPPEVLNLVLIDFKGGASFAGLEPAPHVAAVITNLSDKAALVTRMRDALTGEINRRQEVLRAAGNLDGIAAYRRARRSQPRSGPLPALFIIVDEFSELLSQHPDFADVFAAIGRLGRSLGMHLLLASQRLDEGRLRGLESHLSYRVCLKTLSANESRVVLGTSDAYELPAAPGAAYLRVGADPPVRFQAAYVSGPAHPKTFGDVAPRHDDTRVRVFTTEPIGIVTGADSVTTDVEDRPTVLQTIVERLSACGPPAHPVWLPPLAASPPLDAVLAEAGPLAALTIPIGTVDRPFEQRRTPLLIDLSGAAGHVAVVGGPQSGKSTALRTLVTALAVAHDPGAVQIYCLDLGGGMLTSLRDWPHVGSVAGRADGELIRRMIAEISAVMRSREKLFADHGIESMAHYRRLKAAHHRACDRLGDVFLIVDGWAGLHRESEIVVNAITAMAAEGLSFGVHVVLSASRWADIRPALRDQIGTRIELRLGDAADSELDRRKARDVPTGQPGRGLSHDGLHMVIALPRIDGTDSTSDLVEASAQVGAALRRRHVGCSAPPIALLPAAIDYHSLIGRSANGLVLGVEETELKPVAIDFTQQLHLLILGDSECGKTATLRTICRELVRTTNTDQCRVVVVDVRRALLDVVESETGQIGAYLGSVDAISAALPGLIDELRRRMPPPDATTAQLRSRSWWSGPDIYVVIDDYELVGTVTGNPLAALAEMLPYARDVGLHLLVARRSAGAARAMFEPLLGGLRDAGCLTLLMSGSPDEGLAVESIRQSPMPPGRGTLITRRGAPRVVQIAWSPPE